MTHYPGRSELLLPTTKSSSEVSRLDELRHARVLGTPSDPDFDDLLRLASEMSGIPQGAITFVDEHKVFHKACLGFEGVDLPRTLTFCNHTIQQDGLLIVEDARQDARFRDNPVAVAAGIRFYAGVPLTMPSGHRLGALCLFDRKPQTISSAQKNIIRCVARQVVTLLKLRVEKARAVNLAEQLARQQELFEVYFDNSPVHSCLKDAEGRILLYNRAFAKRFNVTSTEWIGKKTEEIWPSDIAEQVENLEIEARITKTPVTRYIDVSENGKVCSWRTTRIHCKDREGNALRLSISVELTREMEEKRQIEAAKHLLQRLNSQLADMCRRDEAN